MEIYYLWCAFVVSVFLLWSVGKGPIRQLVLDYKNQRKGQLTGLKRELDAIEKTIVSLKKQHAQQVYAFNSEQFSGLVLHENKRLLQLFEQKCKEKYIIQAREQFMRKTKNELISKVVNSIKLQERDVLNRLV